MTSPRHPTDPDQLALLMRRRAAAGPVLVPAQGSSMSPTIEGGAEVEVLGAARPKRGEVWCYIDDRGMAVVHRVRAVRDGMVVLRGDGNRSNDPPVPERRMVGRAVRVVRGRRLGRLDRSRSVARQVVAGLWRRRRRRPGTRRPDDSLG